MSNDILTYAVDIDRASRYFDIRFECAADVKRAMIFDMMVHYMDACSASYNDPHRIEAGNRFVKMYSYDGENVIVESEY